jgi:hypothetical protein
MTTIRVMRRYTSRSHQVHNVVECLKNSKVSCSNLRILLLSRDRIVSDDIQNILSGARTGWRTSYLKHLIRYPDAMIRHTAGRLYLYLLI